MEEHLQLPPSTPKLEELISYSLHPEITEEKLMNDKALFWLEDHVQEKLNGYVKSCRRVLEEYDG